MIIWILIGIFVCYKLLDWLIRIPFISTRNDKYVLITGCDTGFGNMLAKRLDNKGCHVIAGCLTEAGETDLRKACSSKIRTVHMDVTNAKSIQQAFDSVKSHIPADKGLWGIVNNAGIGGNLGSSAFLLMEDFVKVYGVNIFGMAEATRVFLPFVKRARGRIVNTSSIIGRLAFPTNAAYVSSKFAVQGYSDVIRRELRHFGISVHILEPGFYKTNMANPDRLIKCFTDTWNRAPQELRDEYGQKYFDAYVELLNTDMPQFMSTKLDEVVDAYEHALFSRCPRDRYQVGWDSRLFFIPVSNLPAWIQDTLLRLLIKQKMIPAGAKKYVR